MLLSLTLENRLLEFLRIFHYYCRVLSRNAVESFVHLLVVLLLHRLDGCTVPRLREFDVLIDSLRTQLGESGVCLTGTQFHCTSKVSCHEFAHLFLLLSGHCIDCCDSFLVAGLWVLKVLSLNKFTCHHLEIGHFSEVLLNGSLVDEESGRSICLALDLNSVLGKFLLLGRGCSHLDGELHKPLHAYILLCGKAEYRIYCLLADTYAQALADLVFGEHSCVEVFFHKAVVKFGSPFDEFAPEFLSLSLK